MGIFTKREVRGSDVRPGWAPGNIIGRFRNRRAADTPAASGAGSSSATTENKPMVNVYIDNVKQRMDDVRTRYNLPEKKRDSASMKGVDYNINGVPQEWSEGKNYCSEAAAVMLLKFWDVTDYNQDWFQHNARIYEDAIRSKPFTEVLDTKTVKVPTKEMIVSDIEENRPVMLRYKNPTGGKHTVIVTGFNGEGFIVNDPDLGPNTIVTYDFFETQKDGALFSYGQKKKRPAQSSKPASAIRSLFTDDGGTDGSDVPDEVAPDEVKSKNSKRPKKSKPAPVIPQTETDEPQKNYEEEDMKEFRSRFTKLTPRRQRIVANRADKYMKGMSRYIATSPNESPSVTQEQAETVYKIFEEKLEDPKFMLGHQNWYESGVKRFGQKFCKNCATNSTVEKTKDSADEGEDYKELAEHVTIESSPELVGDYSTNWFNYPEMAKRAQAAVRAWPGIKGRYDKMLQWALDKAEERFEKYGKDIPLFKLEGEYIVSIDIRGMQSRRIKFDISTDPIDVLVMSTDQKWSSCNNLNREWTGTCYNNAEAVFSDIANLNGVVYFYKEIGKTGEFESRPYGRLSLRWCVNDRNEYDVVIEPLYTEDMTEFERAQSFAAVYHVLLRNGYQNFATCTSPFPFYGHADTNITGGHGQPLKYSSYYGQQVEQINGDETTGDSAEEEYMPKKNVETICDSEAGECYEGELVNLHDYEQYLDGVELLSFIETASDYNEGWLDTDRIWGEAVRRRPELQLKKEEYYPWIDKSVTKAQLMGKYKPDIPIDHVVGEYEFRVNFDAMVIDTVRQLQSQLAKILRDYDPELMFQMDYQLPANWKKVGIIEDDKLTFVDYSGIIKDEDIINRINAIKTRFPPEESAKNVKLVITNDPVEVLLKSTGRDWWSCENLYPSDAEQKAGHGVGSCRAGAFQDVENRNGIALFYVQKGDGTYNMGNADGRVMLRWCEADTGKLDIGAEIIVYASDRNKSKYAAFMAPLLDVLISKGYLQYDTCTTPYKYAGWADSMKYKTGGSPINVNIRYEGGRSARDFLLKQAMSHDISDVNAYNLANNEDSQIRETLAQNTAICDYPMVILKLIQDPSDRVIYNLLHTCSFDALSTEELKPLLKHKNREVSSHAFRNYMARSDVPKLEFEEYIKLKAEANPEEALFEYSDMLNKNRNLFNVNIITSLILEVSDSDHIAHLFRVIKQSRASDQQIAEIFEEIGSIYKIGKISDKVPEIFMIKEVVDVLMKKNYRSIDFANALKTPIVLNMKKVEHVARKATIEDKHIHNLFRNRYITITQKLEIAKIIVLGNLNANKIKYSDMTLNSLYNALYSSISHSGLGNKNEELAWLDDVVVSWLDKQDTGMLAGRRLDNYSGYINDDKMYTLIEKVMNRPDYENQLMLSYSNYGKKIRCLIVMKHIDKYDDNQLIDILNSVEGLECYDAVKTIAEPKMKKFIDARTFFDESRTKVFKVKDEVHIVPKIKTLNTLINRMYGNSVGLTSEMETFSKTQQILKIRNIMKMDGRESELYGDYLYYLDNSTSTYQGLFFLESYPSLEDYLKNLEYMKNFLKERYRDSAEGMDEYEVQLDTDNEYEPDSAIDEDRLIEELIEYIGHEKLADYVTIESEVVGDYNTDWFKYPEMLERAKEVVKEWKGSKGKEYEESFKYALEQAKKTFDKYGDKIPLFKLEGEYEVIVGIPDAVSREVSEIQMSLLEYLETAHPDKEFRFETNNPEKWHMVGLIKGDKTEWSRVAKYLRKAPAEVSNLLTRLPKKPTVKKIKFKISTDPIDLLVISTGQAWQSCTTLNKEWQGGYGSNQDVVWSLIANCNAVVYYYSLDKDTNQFNTKPYARSLLTWCKSDSGNFDVGMETSVYPNNLSGSEKTQLLSGVLKLLTEHGLQNYKRCVSPYTFQGYCDTGGGHGGNLKYNPYIDHTKYNTAQDKHITMGQALDLARDTTEIRETLAKNSAVCKYQNIVDRLSRDMQRSVSEAIGNTCDFNDLPTKNLMNIAQKATSPKTKQKAIMSLLAKPDADPEFITPLIYAALEKGGEELRHAIVYVINDTSGKFDKVREDLISRENPDALIGLMNNGKIDYLIDRGLLDKAIDISIKTEGTQFILSFMDKINKFDLSDTIRDQILVYILTLMRGYGEGNLTSAINSAAKAGLSPEAFTNIIVPDEFLDIIFSSKEIDKGFKEVMSLYVLDTTFENKATELNAKKMIAQYWNFHEPQRRNILEKLLSDDNQEVRRAVTQWGTFRGNGCCDIYKRTQSEDDYVFFGLIFNKYIREEYKKGACKCYLDILKESISRASMSGEHITLESIYELSNELNPADRKEVVELLGVPEPKKKASGEKSGKKNIDAVAITNHKLLGVWRELYFYEIEALGWDVGGRNEKDNHDVDARFDNLDFDEKIAILKEAGKLKKDIEYMWTPVEEQQDAAPEPDEEYVLTHRQESEEDHRPEFFDADKVIQDIKWSIPGWDKFADQYERVLRASLERAKSSHDNDVLDKIVGMYYMSPTEKTYLKEPYTIVITNNPIAILSRSTGRQWTNCESIYKSPMDKLEDDEYGRRERERGGNWVGVFSDIENNNSVAFFYNKSQEMVGQASLRWCIDDTGKKNVGIDYAFISDKEIGRIGEDSIRVKSAFRSMLVSLLKQLGYFGYKDCTTPYAYHGYSNIMRGRQTHIVFPGDKHVPDDNTTYKIVEQEKDASDDYDEYDAVRNTLITMMPEEDVDGVLSYLPFVELESGPENVADHNPKDLDPDVVLKRARKEIEGWEDWDSDQVDRYESDLISAVNNLKKKHDPDSPIDKIVGEYTFNVEFDENKLEKIENLNERIGKYIKMTNPELAFVFDARTPDNWGKIGLLQEKGKIEFRSIGKLLRDAPAHIKKLLTRFPKSKKDTKIHMVISTDPIDILQKSTNQKWSSCETLGDDEGAFEEGPFSDIYNGNAIAYIWSGGKHSGQPDGRVMIRWCVDDKGNKNIGIEPKIYASYEDFEDFRVLLAPIVKILRERGYLDYKYCKTPYIYHGYSDIMRHGGEQIKYVGGESNEMLLELANDPNISYATAMYLTGFNMNVRNRLVQNNASYQYKKVVLKLMKDDVEHIQRDAIDRYKKMVFAGTVAIPVDEGDEETITKKEILALHDSLEKDDELNRRRLAKVLVLSGMYTKELVSELDKKDFKNIITPVNYKILIAEYCDFDNASGIIEFLPLSKIKDVDYAELAMLMVKKFGDRVFSIPPGNKEFLYNVKNQNPKVKFGVSSVFIPSTVYSKGDKITIADLSSPEVSHNSREYTAVGYNEDMEGMEGSKYTISRVEVSELPYRYVYHLSNARWIWSPTYFKESYYDLI